MLERLPTPWGLVRSGVAPDHPKIKSVTRVYEKTAAHPALPILRQRHLRRARLPRGSARPLPRDRLRHRLARRPASRHPRRRPPRLLRGDRVRRLVQRPSRPHRSRACDLLSAERAVVIGNGNVALDVARMLVARPRGARPHRHRRPRARRARAQPRHRDRGRRPSRTGAGRLHQPRAARARRAGRRRRDRRPRRARPRPRRDRPRNRGQHDRPPQRRDPARLRRPGPTRTAPAHRPALPALAGRTSRRARPAG